MMSLPSTMAELARRRQRLAAVMQPNSIAILPAAKEAVRNGDTVYPFRQHSDFYYLTGFTEPDAVMVLMSTDARPHYILFNRERNTDREKWDGPRAGQTGARETFLADESFPYAEFETRLPELLKGKSTIYYPLGREATFDQCIMKSFNQLHSKVRAGVLVPEAVCDLSPLIYEMRLFKSESEIALMQQAVDISVAGHTKVMQACKPGMYEYELQAILSHEFTRLGAPYHAYYPIVGAGHHSCTLHYMANNARILANDIVLIDAGAEYQYYAADITRTFPANGRFSAEQKAIYDLVLAAQSAAIATIKPGNPWDAAQLAIVNVLTQGLIDLKILVGSLAEHLEKQSILPYYMHLSGHWLGLDVHDVGRYKEKDGKTWRPLAPNMVLTVEPGLYLAETIPDLPARWHNIGVRIEDDVLVTEQGARVLSEALPKTTADIEAIMQ